MSLNHRHHFDQAPSVASPSGGVLLPVVGTPSDGDVPIYDAAASRWEPGAQTGGGGGGGGTVDTSALEASIEAARRVATLALYLHGRVI